MKSKLRFSWPWDACLPITGIPRASFGTELVPQPHLTQATFLHLSYEIQHKDVLKRESASSGFPSAWGRDTVTHPP